MAAASVAGAVGHVLRWALIPVLAVGAVPALDLATGGHGTAAVMAALADPLSVLAARSPGGRPAGALTQSKPIKKPSERVLAEALTRPLRPTDAPGLGTGPLPAEVVLPGSPVTDMTPSTGTDIGDVVPGPVGSTFYPGGGIAVTPYVGVIPGFGGGGGGSGGGEIPTTPVTTLPIPETPAASVPEPETWLSLMIGFGAIGGTLRFGRRRAVAARQV